MSDNYQGKPPDGKLSKLSLDKYMHVFTDCNNTNTNNKNNTSQNNSTNQIRTLQNSERNKRNICDFDGDMSTFRNKAGSNTVNNSFAMNNLLTGGTVNNSALFDERK